MKKMVSPITFKQSLALISGYARGKIFDQAKAVSFIIVYLLLFQVLALNLPPHSPLLLAVGLVSVIVGLAFFLEGLFLGVMPLAEMAGSEVPAKNPLVVTLLLAMGLGALAALAEPALSVIKTAASVVPAYKAPLVFYLLGPKIGWLIGSIAVGIGLAMALGAMRALKGWGLKPLLFILGSFCLILTVISYFVPKMRPFAALAWDSGGIATGPVTVPLIIAFGLGISRMAGGEEKGSSGLGVVTLANLLPIIASLVLGFFCLGHVPQPTENIEAFFADPKTVNLFAGAAEMEAYQGQLNQTLPHGLASVNFKSTVKSQGLAALQAIAPLTAALALAIVCFVRRKPSYLDEKILGVGFALAGIFLFNVGIQLGLVPLGDRVGRNISSFLTPAEMLEDTQLIHNFDMDDVYTAVLPSGQRAQFFYYKKDGAPAAQVPFIAERFNEETGIYTYIPMRGPADGKEKSFLGFGIIIAFGIFLGLGATMAEPTLSTLAITIEDATAGAFKRTRLTALVAVGVGVGLSLGILKILFNIPLALLLAPLYLFLLVLSIFSDNDFVEVAWDSAGVTTGPITVPLVVSLSLGLSSQLKADDSFGLLTMAAMFPVATVLAAGLISKAKESSRIQDNSGGDAAEDAGDKREASLAHVEEQAAAVLHKSQPLQESRENKD